MSTAVPAAATLALAIALTTAPAEARAALPPIPAGWSSVFDLGMADGLGDARGIRETAPFGLRSQYLAGGVNTGNGWTSWAPGGEFVSRYAQESFENGITPVFDYYMLLHSDPGTGDNEGERDYANLTNAATMAAYYADLRSFFEEARKSRDRAVVLHFEPDLWGFLQQRSLFSNAAQIPVMVGATGDRDLAGFPDTASGLAQAIVALRDRYAPNVLVAYHLSIWGTGEDIIYSAPSDARVEFLARDAAAFYRSLRANFDVVFTDTSDRDAGFKADKYGDARAWWTADDYAHHVRFLSTFSGETGKRIVLWQTPLGNTRMRAQDNTQGHYQDNHVQWLIDDPSRSHLLAYANAGVIAVIFGGGGAGTTCACDAMRDGVTNPAPINGNVLVSLSADDDGGFFRDRAAAYYRARPLPLPTGPAVPVSSPIELDRDGCLTSRDGPITICPRRRSRRG